MSDRADSQVILEVDDITKQFPGVLANDRVSLSLRRGEILALLGENGAGKSTLMNIVYGLYRPDSGVLRVRGREVRFASAREAIQNGIGMVHQHFQLVDVMTVAENVVLGEERTVAVQGRGNRLMGAVLRWLPSITIFVFSLIIGFALGQPKYLLGSAVVGLGLGLGVAFPAAARPVWGVVWSVGLALLAVWIAARVELITQVALTDVALRQTIETVDERTAEDGTKITVVQRERIRFDWRREARDAGSVENLMATAKARLEEYRGRGVPGWLIDAIDDWPPRTRALSAALFLLVFGWHSLKSWRGTSIRPAPLHPPDQAVLGALVLFYGFIAWTNLDHVSDALRVALTALVIAGLGWALVRTMQRRRARGAGEVAPISPLDGALDAFNNFLHTVTQIRDERLAAERVRELSQQYGLEVDPDAVIERLPVGVQQRVEIVKALYRDADILILDEPTAVLTPQESRELFKIMRELAAQGVSIIFITHKLKEVFEVATHIVVMRDGRVVGTTTPAEATEASLAAMMVGREVILEIDKGEAQPAGPVLEVSGLNALNDRGAQALNDVSFTVRAGEVLGIAGVQGNGQTELVEVLTGLRAATSGSVRLLGVELQPDVQPVGGLWQRAAAFVLDMIVVGLIAYLLGYFVAYFGESTFRNASTATRVAGALIAFVVVDALYFLGSWKVAARTLGMSIFSLEIADEQDHHPATLRLALRYLIWLALRLPAGIPALISFAQTAQDPEHRTWFDRRLGLRVIRRARITARDIKDVGSSHVPENRQRHGLVSLYSVADNLILNDYYAKPFAQEPTLVTAPLALGWYALVFGAVVAGLMAVALWAWDGWLWPALLDLYNVPPDMRDFARDVALGSDRAAALQWPLIISILALLGAGILFGIIAHGVTVLIFGAGPVRALRERVRDTLRGVAGQAPGAPQDGGLLRDEDAILDNANRLIEEYDIRTPSPDTAGGSLSGGNQQKLIVAREFSRQPRLLIAAQPTRGIDVGSIEFIHRRIIDQRDEGAAVLLVSAELDEIMALSDRIAVMYKGEIIDTVDARQATREQIGLLMAGIHPDQPSGERFSPALAGT
ncbi:MAG: ATP-binding cassette domain-containing protein [Anaerolineae bacterium]|nr:ATP-binding cassette domain-containing protein [Anaerolineae bacterium]